MNTRGRPSTDRLALFGGSKTLGGVEVFNARLASLAKKQGVEVHQARLNSHLEGRNRVLASLNFLRSSILRLVYLWFRQPDTVVVSAANFLDVMTAAGLSCFSGRRDIMVIAHFNASWGFWNSQRLVRLFRSASHRLRVFCIAPNQKTYFVRQRIRVEDDIFPNFINYQINAAGTDRTQYAAGCQLKTLFVGRIVPEKRVNALSAFLARVANERMPIELNIIGARTPQRESEILRHQTCDFRIIFHGTKSESEVSQALHKAMLFCSFSASDTLPLNMLEAAAHGVPILTLSNAVTKDVRDLVGELIFVGENEPVEVIQEKINTALSSQKDELYSDFVAKNDRSACRILGIKSDGAGASVKTLGQ